MVKLNHEYTIDTGKKLVQFEMNKLMMNRIKNII